MYKMRISPETTGYASEAGDTVLAVQLAGGAPRLRLDQLGAAYRVDVQWTVGPSDYNYLCAFYQYGTVNGSLPFQIDLLGIDGSAVQTYMAYFVPGSWKLAATAGLTYTQSAQLWAMPLDPTNTSCLGKSQLVDFPLTAGQVTYSFASTVTLAGDTSAGSSTGTNCSGRIIQIAGYPLSQNVFGTTWSGFAMPTLPAGATVLGIHPVVVAALDTQTTSTIVAICDGYNVGTGSFGTETLADLSVLNPNAGTFETFVGISLGTTPGVLTNFDITAWSQTTFGSTLAEPCYLTVSFVGVAVNYE